jgi:hypothetical protein
VTLAPAACDGTDGVVLRPTRKGLEHLGGARPGALDLDPQHLIQGAKDAGDLIAAGRPGSRSFVMPRFVQGRIPCP